MKKESKEQISDSMLEELTSALENISLETEDKAGTSAGAVYSGAQRRGKSGKKKTRKKETSRVEFKKSDFKKEKPERKRRKKKENGKGWLILIVVCLLVMAFSIYQLLSIFLEYKAGEDEYEDLQQYLTSEITEEEESMKPASKPQEESDQGNNGEETEGEEPEVPEQKPEEERLQRVSFGELKNINSDIVGWIEIPGTNISYPIMKGADNAYYLNHTFKGKVNSAGSIFMEVLNSSDFTDYHTLVYGHNMKNGSMFGTLSYYKSPSYLVAHPYIYVDTEYGQQKYQIFSCYETSAVSDSYTIGFAPDEVYQEYLNTIKGRSAYDTGVEVTMEDKIISLSTCTKSGEDMRYLVHAKLVP